MFDAFSMVFVKKKGGVGRKGKTIISLADSFKNDYI